MSKLGLRRPSPATVISAIALFVALGSGAYAATHLSKNSVGSKAIKNGAVKSADIHNHGIKGHDIHNGQVKTAALHNGAVTAGKASFIRTGFVGSSNSTTSNTAVDLGGPSVTVNVPSGGVVDVFAQAQIAHSGGGANASGQVSLVEPKLVPGPQEILGSAANAFTTVYSAPGSSDFNGVVNKTRGGWITMVPPPGTYTFSLRYAAPGGGTATFQNRALLVRVTR